MSNGTGPSQVLIIRHGEKLEDPSGGEDGGPDLSIRGSSRAAALYSRPRPPISPARLRRAAR
jgi:broad specificity phosphatase PhoE